MSVEEAIVTIYITSLVTAVCVGLVLPQILLQGILLGMILSVMNGIQFLSLHRYKSPDASSHGQLDDTLTLNADNDLLTELWAPVGQGYHALHHLFPQLPYHHMPEAHRRLKLLPANIAYRATESPGLLQTIRALAERSDA
jgi:fatty acid desaturase